MPKKKYVKAIILFQGEMMQCFRCKRCWKSDKNIESNWTAIQLDHSVGYCCPECFGNDVTFWRSRDSQCVGGKNSHETK